MGPEGCWILSHGGKRGGWLVWRGEDVGLLLVVVRSEEGLEGTLLSEGKENTISQLCVEKNFLEKRISSRKMG